MQKISTKRRSVRALVATGVAGAGLVLSGFAGTIAESRPMGSSIIIDPCQVYVADAAQAYYPPCETPNTRNTIPENQTTTTEARETTTTSTPRETTTTQGTTPETPTTEGPEESTTTTAPAAAAATAARPVAAQATYTG